VYAATEKVMDRFEEVFDLIERSFALGAAPLE